MLDKIVHISSDMQFKYCKKQSQYKNLKAKKHISEIFSHDSIFFSPAAIYLSSLQWTFNEITFPTENKINLDFLISNFHFSTGIDVQHLTTLPELNLKVSAKIVELNKEGDFAFYFKLQKKYFKFEENNKKVELNNLYTIFRRALEIDDFSEEISELKKRSLLENIENDLYEELNIIFDKIFVLIAKLKKFNLSENYFVHEINEPKIRIKDIKKLN